MEWKTKGREFKKILDDIELQYGIHVAIETDEALYSDYLKKKEKKRKRRIRKIQTFIGILLPLLIRVALLYGIFRLIILLKWW